MAFPYGLKVSFYYHFEWKPWDPDISANYGGCSDASEKRNIFPHHLHSLQHLTPPPSSHLREKAVVLSWLIQLKEFNEPVTGLLALRAGGQQNSVEGSIFSFCLIPTHLTAFLATSNPLCHVHSRQAFRIYFSLVYAFNENGCFLSQSCKATWSGLSCFRLSCLGH